MSERPTVKGILFDYGATLDTGGDHWVWVFIDAYAAAGMPMDFAQFREAYIAGERAVSRADIKSSTGLRELLGLKIGAQLDALGHGADPALRDRITGQCVARVMTCTARAAEVLAQLRELYALGVVSNFYGNLRTVLAETGLAQYFTAAVDSGVAGVRKPDPAIFRLGCETLLLPPGRVLVAGDSPGKDIAPAQALGCRTALVTGRGWPCENAPGAITDLSGTLEEIGAVLIQHNFTF